MITHTKTSGRRRAGAQRAPGRKGWAKRLVARRCRRQDAIIARHRGACTRKRNR